MPHQPLQGISRKRVVIGGRKRPAKIVEAVHMAAWRVFVVFVARQVDSGGLLDPLKLDPERGPVVRPREHQRAVVNRGVNDSP